MDQQSSTTALPPQLETQLARLSSAFIDVTWAMTGVWVEVKKADDLTALVDALEGLNTALQQWHPQLLECTAAAYDALDAPKLAPMSSRKAHAWRREFLLRWCASLPSFG